MRDVVPSGDAVVETPQGIVFTRGGLVGETVRIGLDPKAGRVRRGRIVEVLTPSPARVVPPCRYAVRCGGCTLMHASLPEQRALRARFLRDALRKAGAPEDLTLHVTESAQDLGYRRRARLAFRRAKKSAQLGFRRERSHELVDIESCPVLVAPLEQALAALRTRLLPHLDGEGELSLALGRDGRAVAVIKTRRPSRRPSTRRATRWSPPTGSPGSRCSRPVRASRRSTATRASGPSRTMAPRSRARSAASRRRMPR